MIINDYNSVYNIDHPISRRHLPNKTFTNANKLFKRCLARQQNIK